MKTEMKRTLHGPGGLTVVLDRNEVHVDDPGAGAPAMVHLPFGRGEGTYWRVLGEGTVDDDSGHETALTAPQRRWIDSIDAEVDTFLYGDDANARKEDE